MKAIKLCVLIYVLGISLSASALDVDRYKDFGKQGVLDTSVSNHTANEIILAGITSNDAEIVNLTIKALSTLSVIIANDHRINPYGPVPSRSFPEVPGLKEFLIDHWKKQHAENGYNNSDSLHQSLELKDGENDLPPDIRWELLQERVIGWPSIPQILCVFWPGDADVHQLLWYFQDTDMSSTHHMATLNLLNIGKFVTPEADAFRISHISGQTGVNFDSYIAVGEAAEGLALNRPIDALPHLITAGKEHLLAKEWVLVALSGYAEDQLMPYADDLKTMIGSGKPMYPTDAISEAYDRLKLFLNRTAR